MYQQMLSADLVTTYTVADNPGVHHVSLGTGSYFPIRAVDMDHRLPERDGYLDCSAEVTGKFPG
jgi:hypothetical protein